MHPPDLAARILLAISILGSPLAAQVELVEPGHTLTKLVDSANPLHPSQAALVGEGRIESVTVHPATGEIYVQLSDGDASEVGDTTSLFRVSPAGVVEPLALDTGLGVDGKGCDILVDPLRGLLLTQDHNSTPARVASVDLATGAIETYAAVTAPVFTGGTFGLDFSFGFGASTVPIGDLVFINDAKGSGIHTTGFGADGSTVEVDRYDLPGVADDLIVLPDGTWVWIGDGLYPVATVSPDAEHVISPLSLSIQGLFDATALPFERGSRADGCSTTGVFYISCSAGIGGSAVFRVDPIAEVGELLVTIGVPNFEEGLQDLAVGPATAGVGSSLFFTVQDEASGGAEVWELTLDECPDYPVICDCTSGAPCQNEGGPGNGCANSNFSGGAHLQASGLADLENDRLTLIASGLAQVNGFAMFFQGDLALLPPFKLGDGLLCAESNFVRLPPNGLLIEPTGTAVYPAPSFPDISVASAEVDRPIAPGDTRIYQLLYRDTSGPCGTLFNLTNALSVTWQ